MRSRRSTKDLYVVKSEADKLRKLEPKKQKETRGVYVLRTNEEVINKFADIIYDFVDEGGFFLLLGSDKVFYQTLRRSLVFELGVATDFIQVEHEPQKGVGRLQKIIAEDLAPFVFLEHRTEGVTNLQVLSGIKQVYPDVPVILTTRALDKEHLLQFYEEGADYVLDKSASVNEIIRKIVHLLKPQTEIDELVNVGHRLNEDNRFEDAIRLANTILTKRPKSPRAHLIMGDAFKGLAKRKQALAEYQLAEQNSNMFIEPLKKIFILHAEDGNKDGMLDYLVKLDDMSPLNFNRKVKIADLNYDMGKVEDAEAYYDNAIKSAASEAQTIVGEMSLDIAEKLTKTNPELAAKYFRKSLDLVRDSTDMSCMNMFNRLGISLRKAGLWAEAVEAYVAAEKLSPGDENIQYNLGLAYYDGKDYVSARKRLLMGLKINPRMFHKNAEVAYNMGLIFLESGDKPKAEKLIRHCLEIDPGHEGARSLGLV
ncbi:tetratricopeptide repeat protein [uncultured Pseudodesulfovibrio sp.]|uniref:tetratricopeptide repeat protein n=1 Tax=uncultured Pseudodesulfovibrio sp. TaxID=2035858 RepID=UPI0029C85F9B|nr:tetratricopeptide repeat protein [uncultured Pseudodesulfovibrio sp.]